MTRYQASLRTAVRIAGEWLGAGLALGVVAAAWTRSVGLGASVAGMTAVLVLPALGLGFMAVAALDSVRSPVPATGVRRTLRHALRVPVLLLGAAEVLACPTLLALAVRHDAVRSSHGIMYTVALAVVTLPWGLQGVRTIRAALQVRAVSP